MDGGSIPPSSTQGYQESSAVSLAATGPVVACLILYRGLRDSALVAPHVLQRTVDVVAIGLPVSFRRLIATRFARSLIENPVGECSRGV